MDEFRVSYFKVYDAHGAKIFCSATHRSVDCPQCGRRGYDKIKSEIGLKYFFMVENPQSRKNYFRFFK